MKKNTRSNWIVVGLAWAILALFLLLPMALILREAFGHGFGAWWAAITERDTLSAALLTVLVAIIVVPLNTFFGIIIAWTMAKFNFRGRGLLLGLIDFPLTVSPVVAGLIFVLLLGPRNGWFGPWLEDHNIRLLFTVPSIIIASLFVTFPFVARELISLMREQGSEEEQAALSLGASPLRMFWKVTLPNIKWGLLYGVILCTARCIGEFGAVSVVSGHVRGETTTLPLQVEILYNEYQFTAAFAAATLLGLIAVVTVILRSLLAKRKEVAA